LSIVIKWDDFDQEYPDIHQGDVVLHPINQDPLPDGDLIWLTHRPLTDQNSQDSIEIVLTLGSGVSWWKEIKAIAANGSVLQKIARSRSHREPASFKVKASDVSAFVFSKAKFLGWHTEMYKVNANIAQKKGQQLTFSWTKD
jgi:hypothetical protein